MSIPTESLEGFKPRKNPVTILIELKGVHKQLFWEVFAWEVIAMNQYAERFHADATMQKLLVYQTYNYAIHTGPTG